MSPGWVCLHFRANFAVCAALATACVVIFLRPLAVFLLPSGLASFIKGVVCGARLLVFYLRDS